VANCVLSVLNKENDDDDDDDLHIEFLFTVLDRFVFGGRLAPGVGEKLASVI